MVNIRIDPFSLRLIRYYNNTTNNDKWIVDLFKGKKKGFFIEAGAFNGITNSCSYTLEKYFGWKGILIEPSIVFSKLVKNRPKNKCVKALLGNNKSKELFMFLPYAPMSSCTEPNFKLHKNRVVESHKGKHKFEVVKKEIETKTLFNVLNETNAPKIIDYLALDIEGSEYEVLKLFPFDKYKFRAISIEGNSCNELLISKGYKKVRNKFNKKANWENYFVSE